MKNGASSYTIKGIRDRFNTTSLKKTRTSISNTANRLENKPAISLLMGTCSNTKLSPNSIMVCLQYFFSATKSIILYVTHWTHDLIFFHFHVRPNKHTESKGRSPGIAQSFVWYRYSVSLLNIRIFIIFFLVIYLFRVNVRK